MHSCKKFKTMRMSFVALLLVVLSATAAQATASNYPSAPRFKQASDSIGPAVPFNIAADYTANANVEDGFRLYQDGVAVLTLPAGAAVNNVVTFARFTQGKPEGSYVYVVASFKVVDATEYEARSGALTLNVTSTPPPQCTFTFSRTTVGGVPASGGADGVGLTASDQTCAWTSTANVPWLSTNPPSGTGSMGISYVVQANTGPERTGVITIGNATLTVTQAAGGPPAPQPCTFTISPTSANVPAAGGTGSVNVLAAPTGCSPTTFTATANDPWLTVVVAGMTASYTAGQNTSTSSRTGTLTIAGQTFTITQAGAVAPPSGNCVDGTRTVAPGTGFVEQLSDGNASQRQTVMNRILALRAARFVVDVTAKSTYTMLYVSCPVQ